MTSRIFQRNTQRTALICALVGVGMLGLSYASVPLYRLFCQLTGFGGTTQTAEAAPQQILQREITVRFDANVAQNMPWKFAPAQHSQKLKVGEVGLAFFTAENTSGKPVTGTATFNVTPNKAGVYFSKLDCFCFTEQRLEPGEKIDMPVQYFIDPAIDQDEHLREIKTVTLSYTFHPSANLAANTRE